MRDGDKNGRVLIEFVRRRIICKKISDFELSFKECICIFGDAFAISNNGGLCFSIYRPPDSSNLSIFLKKYQCR